jgi:NAD(P)-dependent dehydrogenase (short-subunit alcohol dehydrogenase family)
MSNAVVVITGAGSGIGRAAAERMCAEQTVIAIGRTKAKLRPAGHWPQARIDGIVAETPAGRAGTPDEVAGLIQYLCSDAAGFITGEIISQNGGWRFGS